MIYLKFVENLGTEHIKVFQPWFVRRLYELITFSWWDCLLGSHDPECFADCSTPNDNAYEQGGTRIIIDALALKVIEFCYLPPTRPVKHHLLRTSVKDKCSRKEGSYK